MKVWIIEDGRALSKALSEQLRRLRPDIEIAGISTGVKNTLAALRGHDDLDIIFADIKIADGLSFSIFDKQETEAMVVFTTGQYRLCGFNRARARKGLHCKTARTFPGHRVRNDCG